MNMLGGAIIDNILTNFIVGSQQWKYKAIFEPIFIFEFSIDKIYDIWYT